MIQELSKQERLRFSSIMFKDDYTSKKQVQNLEQQEKAKLKSIYDQKIAYETVNAHIQPPPDHHDSPRASQSQSPGIIGTICCCFYPQNYRSTFDITSETFFQRVKRTLMIWKSDFLEYEPENKQLYGTLWITITYIIALGLAANLSEYFHTSKNYSFKGELMLKGFGVVAIFQVAEPFIYAAIVKCLKGNIQNIQSAMISGYSLILYIIPTILCFIPSLYWHVGMLAVAAVLRGIFLLRNYSSKIEEKVYVLAIVILIIQIIYLFVILKTMFPTNAGKTFAQGSKNVFRHFEARQYDF